MDSEKGSDIPTLCSSQSIADMLQRGLRAVRDAGRAATRGFSTAAPDPKRGCPAFQ